jgi:hypothetical protein
MKGLSLRDRKGVSIMIGYVILVTIAIGLSVAVFAFLQLYLPKDTPVCNVDVSVGFVEPLCFDDDGTENDFDDQFTVSLRVANRGLFTVDGAFIRIGEENRIYRQVLGEPEFLFAEDDAGGVLQPNSVSNIKRFSEEYVPSVQNIPHILEIEPFVLVDGKPALCQQSVSRITIQCTNTPQLAGDPDNDGIPSSDGDGVYDPCDADNIIDGQYDGTCDDNCPDHWNAGQGDVDNDGFGDACDCSPADEFSYPGAPEICGNGQDDDCDGNDDASDPDCSGGACTDGDGDFYFLESSGCAGEPGFLGHNDCNDGNPNVNPGAAEICTDGIDNDCDGLTDGFDSDCGCPGDADCDEEPDASDNCPQDPNPGQEDWNTDGQGDVCDDSDLDGVFDDTDNCLLIDNGPLQRSCVNDDNWQQPCMSNGGCSGGPSGPGICGLPQANYNSNALGDACDNNIDGGMPGFNDFWPNGADCNDFNEFVNPSMSEVCGNGIDDNCAGGIDEGCPVGNDADNDGFTVAQNDCNDLNPFVNPGEIELCEDGIDNDCNDLTDWPEDTVSCSGMPGGPPDNDGDHVPDLRDSNDISFFECGNWDNDGASCDDCADGNGENPGADGLGPEPDSDGDGLCDLGDNCPNVANGWKLGTCDSNGAPCTSDADCPGGLPMECDQRNEVVSGCS